MKRVWLVGLFLLIPLILIYRGLGDFYFSGEDFTYLFGLRYRFKSFGELLTYSTSLLWYRPVGLILWYLNYHLSHFTAWQYYLINVSVHFLNALLVYSLAVRLSDSFRVGVWAALLFIVHPAATSTTLYLASRFDLIGTTFILASLILYHSHEDGEKKINYIFSLAFAFLAMLSKEMFITAPVLIFVLSWAGCGDIPVRSKARQALGKSAVFFVLAFIYFFLRMAFVSGLGGYFYKRQDIGNLLLTTPINALHSLVICPRILIFGHLPSMSGMAPTVLALAFVLLAGLVAFFGRRKSRLRLAAWIGILIALFAILPVLNYPRELSLSPRFFYLPLVGVSLFLGSLFSFRCRGTMHRAPTVGWGFIFLIAPCIFWLWGSHSLSKEWKRISHRERIEARQNIKFLHPRLAGSPLNTTIVLFGLDPAGYNLDFTTKTLWPDSSSRHPYPEVLGFRFLYGGRISSVVCLRGLGLERSRRRYRSKADYLSEEDFKIRDTGRLFTEMVKPPDILGELARGESIRVIEYSKDKGLREITNEFLGFLRERKSLGRRSVNGGPDIPVGQKKRDRNVPPTEWDLKRDETWRCGGDLERGSLPGIFYSRGNDPYFVGPSIDLPALGVAALEVTMRVTRERYLSPKITEGQLSWESSVEPPWGLERRLDFLVIADGALRTCRINLGRNPAWYLAGRIKRLRIDPVSFPAEVEIRDIRVIPFEY